MGALQFRVKDIDFLRREITVRDGKGQKDRVSMLAGVAEEPLRLHMEAVRRQHERDRLDGLGRAPLPAALARKDPQADRDWGWLPPLVRDALSRGWLRHPDGSRALGQHVRQHEMIYTHALNRCAPGVSSPLYAGLAVSLPRGITRAIGSPAGQRITAPGTSHRVRKPGPGLGLEQWRQKGLKCFYRPGEPFILGEAKTWRSYSWADKID
jgi:hypothetical protein